MRIPDDLEQVVSESPDQKKARIAHILATCSRRRRTPWWVETFTPAELKASRRKYTGHADLATVLQETAPETSRRVRLTLDMLEARKRRIEAVTRS